LFLDRGDSRLVVLIGKTLNRFAFTVYVNNYHWIDKNGEVILYSCEEDRRRRRTRRTRRRERKQENKKTKKEEHQTTTTKRIRARSAKKNNKQ